MKVAYVLPVVVIVAAVTIPLVEARVRTGSVAVDEYEDNTLQIRLPLDNLLGVEVELPKTEKKIGLLKKYINRDDTKASPARDPYPKTSTTLGSTASTNPPTFLSSKKQSSISLKSSKVSDTTVKSSKASDAKTKESKEDEGTTSWKSTKVPKSDG
jgi:hypothetical protein